jgi:hypothetical protein
MVNEDLPDPDTPVTTMSLSLGISTVTFFRLWTLAPLIRILLLAFAFAEGADFLIAEVFAVID